MNGKLDIKKNKLNPFHFAHTIFFSFILQNQKHVSRCVGISV